MEFSVSIWPILVLALIHFFGGRLSFIGGIPRSIWLSAAGGASVAYIFLHLFPELSEGQEEIEELKMFDVARHQIKASIAGLKSSGEWVGMPFEYEWIEMLDRLPNVLSLYRKSEADKRAKELEQDQGATPAN